MAGPLYEHALWLTIPLFVIAIALLVTCIKVVIRLLRRSLIMRVPLTSQQGVDIDVAGPVILCIEGPQFSRRFAWLTYRLETEEGTEVSWRRRWFRAKTAGFSKVRMETRRFLVPRPGHYTLVVNGIKFNDGEGETVEGHFLVFMKPHLIKSLALVVGITLSAGLAIASLVFSLLRISNVQG